MTVRTWADVNRKSRNTDFLPAEAEVGVPQSLAAAGPFCAARRPPRRASRRVPHACCALPAGTTQQT
eukprot:14478764-Heterocapsa_arctica.AAC.1